jgi:hypothetical protein
MAARLKPYHEQEVRDKIKGSQLVNLLQDVAIEGKFNGEKVASERIRAAEILLKKILPDLKALEHEGYVDTDITLKWRR